MPGPDEQMHILILEDRATDADLIEFELMDAGLDFRPKRTATEKEFLQALEEFSPDLILSDYDLPQYSGDLALVAAKKRLPHVPFILVTGAMDADGERLRKIVARGASDYVLKSRLHLLAPAVRNALRKRKHGRKSPPGQTSIFR